MSANGHIRFTKMEGIGNDYIYINAFEQRIGDPVRLARVMSDRNFGVGGDGVILICPPSRGVKADVRMRMFNADGSESEMCGNGIRCVCKYAHDHGLAKANPMRIQTGRGVLRLEYALDRSKRVKEVTVDMGEPILALKSIGVIEKRLAFKGVRHQWGLEAGPDTVWIAAFVSMGNPHAVLFADENPEQMKRGLKSLRLQDLGPPIENHPAFPNRMNVHFVQVHSRNEITMRTWERGTGITLACGTGASAVCVVGALTGRTSRRILAHLPGGDLRLRWDPKTNHVFKTGPATEVFEGTWSGPRRG